MKKITNLKGLLAIFVVATSLSGQSAGTRDPAVTPVSGQSWLLHLHRSFDVTSMGKTWDMGPSVPLPGEQPSPWRPGLTPRFAANTPALHGSDLYRLNCQACHGATGGGTPPEINSVIGPVQATSVAVILQRTKKAGQEMSRADAASLAKQATVLLLDRFQKGGQTMPAFPQLSEAEIHCLVAYLEQISNVPGAENNQTAVKQSPYHVGEQIVKSTCHICHSAAGPDPTPEQLMQGAIPPLSTLTTRTNLSDFIRKVTSGAPVGMGAAPYSYQGFYRGRMPVFRYLTEDEAADAYLYLSLYPPQI
jgi:mono/diheme cytochrome c family protein